MNDTAKRLKLDRVIGREVSERKYYNLIGLNLGYGLIVNMLMVAFLGDSVRHINMLVFLLIYFVSAFAGIALMASSNNVVTSFIGYNMVVLPVGTLLAIALPSYNLNNIAFAFIEALAITFIMIVISNVKPNVFRKMGSALLTALIGFVIVELLLLIFGFDLMLMDIIAVGIFTLLIGYDWAVAQDYHKSSVTAILVASSLYLDVINLFLRLLNIRSKD